MLRRHSPHSQLCSKHKRRACNTHLDSVRGCSDGYIIDRMFYRDCARNKEHDDQHSEGMMTSTVAAGGEEAGTDLSPTPGISRGTIQNW